MRPPRSRLRTLAHTALYLVILSLPGCLVVTCKIP